MLQRLSKLIFPFCVLCLLLALFSDLPFFWYVKTFSLKQSLYFPIVDLLENSIPFLAFPASFAVFSFLKLHKLGNRAKLIIYSLFGIFSTFLFFQMATAFSGQLSDEYQTWTTFFLSRFYLRLYMVSLGTLFVWPLLADLSDLVRIRNRKSVKQFILDLGIGLLSLSLTLVVFGISSSEMDNLLNRLLLPGKVEDTLPALEGYTNQKIVITDHPAPLLNCYLKQNPSDFPVRLNNLLAGTTFANNLDYNAIYLNDHCLVIYFGVPLTLENNEITESSALLAELLIRLTFGDFIKVNTNKHPAKTITIRDEALLTKGSVRGIYDTENNIIEIQKGYSMVFETITHELLHSFAMPHDSWLGYKHAGGLNEAITEYLTGKVMRRFSEAYSPYIYVEQVAALEKLLKFIDEKKVINTYFNGNLRSLQKDVDNRTYPGAFCRFNNYLDKSLDEYLNTKNFDKSKEYATKAEKALEVKENDSLGCF